MLPFMVDTFSEGVGVQISKQEVAKFVSHIEK